MLSLAPQYLRSSRTKNLRISFEIRARGGRRYRMAITNGTAVVTAAGEKADCVITADPVRSCSSVSAGCRSSPNFCAKAAGGRTQTMVGHDVRHPAGQHIGAEGRQTVCGHHLVATGT
jgi:hypothetical protein